MNTKFTKGEWTVKLYPDGAGVMVNGFSFIGVENIGIDLDYEDKGFSHWADDDSLVIEVPLNEQFANAHLIASAPDMYKLIEDLISSGTELLFLDEAIDEEDAATIHSNFNDKVLIAEKLLTIARGK